MADKSSSFLGLEGLHVFCTGAAGEIGSAAVREFLDLGCSVTAFDRREIDESTLCATPDDKARLFSTRGDLTSETSVADAFRAATDHHGPVNILIANAGITDESQHPPIWEIDSSLWDKVNETNVRGTFFTVKHLLRSVKQARDARGTELENVAIVVTGSETGKFCQEGHAEYASCKAGLQYGLVRTVKNEMVRLNARARINAVAPGWVNTSLIGDRLDDARDMWAECQAAVALKKIAQPEDVARAMAFLASHRAAGHISGEDVSVDGGMEGRLVWHEQPVRTPAADPTATAPAAATTSTTPSPQIQRMPRSLAPPTKRRRLRICLSVDFDAISGYLGTGHDPANTLADYSAGIFSAHVGVGRLLRLFRRHDIADKLTWFLPGHSVETFPAQTQEIVASGAEIGLHGYSHEGAYAMTVQQEKDVLEKCIDLVTRLQQGRRPVGYRAPLYQIRETTVQLLQDHDFLYDSSMNAHDSLPYYLPYPFPSEPPHVPDYEKPASSWMMPTSIPQQPEPGTTAADRALVEIPGSWYTEDMTPLGFYPYSCNTQGYVGVDLVEKMWWDRFDWLWEHESWLDDGPGQGYGAIYPLIWHPESSGRVHIIGMIDRFIAKLLSRSQAAAESEITFETFESVANSWKRRM